MVRGVAFLALGVASMMGPVGCGNRAQERGPLEQAGHDVDHAAQDVAHDVDHAVDEADDRVDEAAH